MGSKATVSSKGQITLPAWARRSLGIGPGATVWLRVEDGRLIIERQEDSILRLRGAARGAYGDPDEYVRTLRSEWDKVDR